MNNPQVIPGSGILVVLDLDGTLYHTETSFFPAVDSLLKAHRMTRQTPVKLEKFIGEPMYVFVDWIKSLGIETGVDELIREFDALEIKAVKSRGALYPGVRSVLRELSRKGATLGICSNGQAHYINSVVDNFDLRSYFSFIRYPQNKAETKTIMLDEIRRRYAPRKAFMVGDRIHDFEGARGAGFISVGVNYGYGEEEVEEADYIISELPELMNILISETDQDSNKD